MTQRYTAKFPLIFSLFVGMYLFISAAAANQLSECGPVNQSVSLEKDGCPVLHLPEVSICSGHCYSQENNIYPSKKNPMNPFKRRRGYQTVCTYREVDYRTVQITGCAHGVDPSITFPVAVTCHCSVCDEENSDCRTLGPQPEAPNLPFYYY